MVARTGFVDQNGQPFSDRIQRVLGVLAPRLRGQFPAFRDEVVFTEILEEAGRRIVDHEHSNGSIQKLRGYAWVTVRNVANARLRRASMRLQRDTLDSVASAVAIAELPADRASAAAIERKLLFDQILECLSAEERKVYSGRGPGSRVRTSRGIAERPLARLTRCFTERTRRQRRWCREAVARHRGRRAAALHDKRRQSRCVLAREKTNEANDCRRPVPTVRTRLTMCSTTCFRKPIRILNEWDARRVQCFASWR